MGKIFAPPSKSHTLRALYFSLLAKGTSTIEFPLKAKDSEAMKNAITLLGANIKEKENAFIVTSQGGIPKSSPCIIDAQNSGIVYRFIAGLAALMESEITITGDSSILNQRPIFPLVQALSSLGASALKQEGAPLIIKGPLSSGKVTIEGGDSQPVSSLLYALSFAKGKSQITVENMREKPWIAVSLSWLDRLHIPYTWQGNLFTLKGNAKISAFSYRVPGDFSSISNFLALSVIQNQKMVIENLNFEDAQGDKIFIDLLRQMGANIEQKGTILTNLPHKGLHGIELDIDSCIDLLPILAVTACFAKGKTTLYNISGAKTKECNRPLAILQELNKMGGKLSLEENSLTIFPSPLHGANLLTHQDHRMALALSIAALSASCPSWLSNPEVVEKTYPSFFEELKNMGAQIESNLCGL